TANRLLAPDLGDRGTDRAAHGLAHHLGIAPARARYGIERAEDGGVHGLLERTAATVFLRETGQHDLRILLDIAAIVHHQRHADMAGEGKPAALGHADLVNVADDRAVLVDAAGDDLVDLLGWRRCETHHGAVLDLEHRGNTELTSEAGMGGEVHGL